MRVTSKGQVTIPIEIRQKLDIQAESEVEFELVGNVVHLRKARGNEERSKRVLAHLLAAPYTGPSTEELMALTRGEE